MTEVVNQAAGIKVELDAVQLGQQVARDVAQHLAHLFPTDAAEFWSLLAEQAHRERQRVAEMLDLVCSHGGGCPYKSSVLAGIRIDAENGPAPGNAGDVNRHPGHKGIS
jgi:hypothetical protein